MTTLRQAAQAVIERWDAPMGSDLTDIGNCMDDLRTALEAPENQVLQAKCDAFLANVQLLEVEIEAMKKERDALRVAGKLALEALEHVEWKNWRTDKAIRVLKKAGVTA